MTDDIGDNKKCHDTAVRLLAIREHSQFELKLKLKTKGHNPSTVDQVVEELTELNLQSDRRYAQSVTRIRQTKGYGPIFIQNYLLNKGVNQELIDSVLDFNDSAWQKALNQTALKKFGSAQPADFKQKAKQMNFLLRRGFSGEQIRNYYDTNIDDVDNHEDQ